MFSACLGFREGGHMRFVSSGFTRELIEAGCRLHWPTSCWCWVLHPSGGGGNRCTGFYLEQSTAAIVLVLAHYYEAGLVPLFFFLWDFEN